MDIDNYGELSGLWPNARRFVQSALFAKTYIEFAWQFLDRIPVFQSSYLKLGNLMKKSLKKAPEWPNKFNIEFFELFNDRV